MITSAAAMLPNALKDAEDKCVCVSSSCIAEQKGKAEQHQCASLLRKFLLMRNLRRLSSSPYVPLFRMNEARMINVLEPSAWSRGFFPIPNKIKARKGREPFSKISSEVLEENFFSFSCSCSLE
jgi:hypothetical protein